MTHTSKSLEELDHLKDNINLLIVTANEIETKNVHDALTPIVSSEGIILVPHENQTYYIGNFGLYTAVHVKCTDMGSTQRSGAINTVRDAIDHWQPKVILMIGVAMGVDDKKQNIGDVLVSESIIQYEIERVGDAPIQRGNIVQGGIVLLNRFKNVVGWTGITEMEDVPARALFGPILSGEKLIDNLDFRTKITGNFPHAIGAEMEGAGVYSASESKSIREWLIVKGICDYGDGNKSTKKNERQHIASKSAVSLCLHVCSVKHNFSALGIKECECSKTKEEIIQADEELPYQHINEESNSKFNSDIVNEILMPATDNNPDMLSPIQLLVNSYLSLNTLEKLTIIQNLSLPLEQLKEMSTYDMDREVFKYVREANLMHDLWETINRIKPYDNQQNPF